LTQQRVKQNFFRKSVLSSYKGKCCMSGLSEERLLIASHIVPWSEDKLNRLNPRNGLCLSAIHDKAFDRGFITLDDDFRVVLSESFKASNNQLILQAFASIEGKPITLPERFEPDINFLEKHRNLIFLDNKASENIGA
ncbi:MAG: HNH endonuclease, partial [Ghiorsea sp.]|nr:HNH endonuclease [Ghiorsea sp.]